MVVCTYLSNTSERREAQNRWMCVLLPLIPKTTETQKKAMTMLTKVENAKTVWIGMTEQQTKELRFAIAKTLNSHNKLDDPLTADQCEVFNDLREAINHV